jgi:protein-tyrosine phosphatase
MVSLLRPLEITEKFQDLEWLQRERMAKSAQEPDLSSPWAVEHTPDTKARNRYTNVYPWANNRIHLQVPPEYCDYINASPIVLRSSKSGEDKKYIATQVRRLSICPGIKRIALTMSYVLGAQGRTV